MRRHCEERSDEAIQRGDAIWIGLLCFALLHFARNDEGVQIARAQSATAIKRTRQVPNRAWHDPGYATKSLN
jgi:hypothetical protein